MLSNSAGKRVMAFCFSLGLPFGSSLLWADQSYNALLVRARLGDEPGQLAFDPDHAVSAPPPMWSCFFLLALALAGHIGQAFLRVSKTLCKQPTGTHFLKHWFNPSHARPPVSLRGRDREGSLLARGYL